MQANFRKALVLFLIAIISGLGIWLVNLATEDQIALNERNRELDFYRDILSVDDSYELDTVEIDLGDGLTEVIVFEVDNPANEFGLVYKGADKNSYGDITILVGIKDDAILSVVISGSTNTPNFVKRVEKNNLGNFDGMSVSTVTYDVKTGASFTYGSVSEVVKMATEAYGERGNE